jgi:hypothetical protein
MTIEKTSALLLGLRTRKGVLRERAPQEADVDKLHSELGTLACHVKSRLEEDRNRSSPAHVREHYRRMAEAARRLREGYEAIFDGSPSLARPMEAVTDFGDIERFGVFVANLKEHEQLLVSALAEVNSTVATRRAREGKAVETELVRELADIVHRYTGVVAGRSFKRGDPSVRGPFVEVVATFNEEAELGFKNIPAIVDRCIRGQRSAEARSYRDAKADPLMDKLDRLDGKIN